MKAISGPDRTPANSTAKPVACLLLTIVFVTCSAFAQADKRPFFSSRDPTTYPSSFVIGEWERKSITSINSNGRREGLNLSTPYGFLSIDPSRDYTLQVVLIQRMPDSLVGRLRPTGGDLADVRFENYAHFEQILIEPANSNMRGIRSSVSTWNGVDFYNPFLFRDGYLVLKVALTTDGNSQGLGVDALWRPNAPQAKAVEDEVTTDCTNRTHPIHERYSVGESRIDK